MIWLDVKLEPLDEHGNSLHPPLDVRRGASTEDGVGVECSYEIAERQISPSQVRVIIDGVAYAPKPIEYAGRSWLYRGDRVRLDWKLHMSVS